MQIQRKYVYLASLIGMAFLSTAFAEPGAAIVPSQANVGRGHGDYIIYNQRGDTIYETEGRFFYDDHLPENKINIADDNTDYTLQINTNWSPSFSRGPCTKDTWLCKVREEFVYDTHYQGTDKSHQGKAGVYIRYWLKASSPILYPLQACPTGWTRFPQAQMCFKDSAFKIFPKIKIKQIIDPDTGLEAIADEDNNKNGYDELIFINKDNNKWNALHAPTPDGIPKLASYWKKASFNIFGVDGGTPLTFASGTYLNLYLTSPTPNYNLSKKDAGKIITEEAANNLNLGSLNDPEVKSPESISFTESL